MMRVHYLCLGLLSACGRQTAPLLAGKSPLPQDATMVSAADVEVLAASHYWNGVSRDCESFITPLAIDIKNRSARRVRIDFDDLSFLNESRQQFHAYHVRPRPGIKGFDWLNRQAPAQRWLVPEWQRDSVERLMGIIEADAPTSALTPDLVRSAAGGIDGLPWREMMRRELPERVLEPGDSTHGFVYFKRLTDTSGERVTLHWLVRDADNDQLLADLQVPFTVGRTTTWEMFPL